jgi:hypothetical protein
VTRERRPGGSKQQEYVPPHFGRPDVQGQGISRTVVSLKTPGENPLQSLWLLAVVEPLVIFFGSCVTAVLSEPGYGILLACVSVYMFFLFL